MADTELDKLIINIGTKEKIDAGIQQGTITEDMLSIVTDQDVFATKEDIEELDEKKVDKVDTASQVYGTDSEGNQTTYNLTTFGQIDNVAIHGVDQTIVSKRVDLSVVEQVNSLPTASEDLVGRVVQYTGGDTQDLVHNYFYECKPIYTDETTVVRSASDQLTASADLNTFAQSGLEYNTPYLYEKHGAYWDCIDPEGITITGPRAGLVLSGVVNSNDQVILQVDREFVWEQANVQPETILEWGNIGGTLSNQTDLQEALDAKQNELTAGTNITITNNVISSTAQESFFRGRFEDWVNVPTDSSLYQANFRGETTPCNSDYMVVDNASGYVNPDFSKDPDNIAIRKSLQDQPYGIDVTIGETTTHYTYTAFPNWTPLTESGWVSIKYSAGSPGRYFIKTNVTYYVDNERHNENTETEVMVTNQSFETVHYISKNPGVAPIPLRGGWNFGYFGTWDEDGKNGWKPQYQVEDVLPIASPTEQGIAKLYTTTGQKTDGSMTQKSITDKLGEKQDTLTAGTNIVIAEDSQTGDLVISSTAYESLFKGKYNTWNDVPTVGANYPLYIDDGVHTHEPTYTDYMVVVDASTVPGGQVPIVITFRINAYGSTGSVKTNIDGTEYNGYGSFDGKVQVRTDVSTGNYGTQFVVLGEDIEYQGTTYHQGEVFLEIIHNRVVYGQEYTYNAQLSLGYPYEGTWRFSYRGVWATDNRNGWKGEYPIEQELPIASDTVAGITKLYNTTGSNTDGSMTQKSITDALNEKQNELTAGTNITIDENNVISSTAQESFFRGKWVTWTSVPTDTSRYPEDYNHNRVPTENDYMVVSDTSDYTAEGMEIKIYWDGWGTHRFSVNDSALVAMGGVNEWVSFNLENDVIIYIKDYEPRYGHFGIKCNVDMLVDGAIVPAGNIVPFIESADPRTVYYHVASGATLSGSWRFAYHGVWSSSGKNGWLPEYQLEDVLPIATPTVAGIAKLYTTTGNNTDGTMDQSSITIELGNKQDLLTNASNAGEGIIIDDVTQEISTNNIVWRKW